MGDVRRRSAGGALSYGFRCMNPDDETPSGLLHWLRERLHIVIGTGGLIAWLVMLWLMFGDVL